MSHRKRVVTCLLVLGLVCTWLHAQDSSRTTTGASATPIRATHVLGFEGLKKNVRGSLTIENGAVQFRKRGNPGVNVSIVAIRDVVVGSENKQVGGLPMLLGKAAIPYSGGRLVSLVSHKKFDTLTVEYLDGDGGFHGAIFRLARGQGQILRNQLIRGGAQVSNTETYASKQNSPGVKK